MCVWRERGVLAPAAPEGASGIDMTSSAGVEAGGGCSGVATTPGNAGGPTRTVGAESDIRAAMAVGTVSVLRSQCCYYSIQQYRTPTKKQDNKKTRLLITYTGKVRNSGAIKLCWFDAINSEGKENKR